MVSGKAGDVRSLARLKVCLLLLQLVQGLHMLRLSRQGDAQRSRRYFGSAVDGGGNDGTGSAVDVIVERRGGRRDVCSGYGVWRMHGTRGGIWLKLWLEMLLALTVMESGGGVVRARGPGIWWPLVTESGGDMTTHTTVRVAGGSRRRVSRRGRRLRLMVHHERVLKVVRQRRRLERALRERAAHGEHASGPRRGSRGRGGLGGHGGVRRVR